LVEFKGELLFNSNYPDGTPRKLLDNSKIRDLGWSPSINLAQGLKRTILEFEKDNYLN